MSTLSMSHVRTRVFVAAVAFAASFPALVAHAQEKQLQVTIPFAFESGSRHLAAGTYVIHMPSEHMATVRGDKAASSFTTVPDANVRPATTSKVVFRKYGERYFLREVWVAGATTHVHCPASKAEKYLEVAQLPELPSTTEVALLATQH